MVAASAEASVVDLVAVSEAALAEAEVYSPTRGLKLPRPCIRFLSEPRLIPTKKEAMVAAMEVVATPPSLALTFITTAVVVVEEVAAMVEDSEAATVVDSEEVASVVEDMVVVAEAMEAPVTPPFR